MDFMRRLQAESPILFLVVIFVGIFIAFQLLLFVAELILGPFGLPGWAPLALVLVGLIVVARRQQNSR
jgi:uncharacterized RDD family membrane protein YckC